ncbi:MAG: FtsL-like putative cell division protein [Bacteroidia bacterium]
MNTYKEPVEETEKIKPPGKPNKIVRFISSIISGSFLTREQSLRYIPFFLFISFLAICYIANGYYAEAKMREFNNLTNELKELRPEFIITKSNLMFISKQSEVAAAALPLGLKESVVPPEKIVIKK